MLFIPIDQYDCTSSQDIRKAVTPRKKSYHRNVKLEATPRCRLIPNNWEVSTAGGLPWRKMLPWDYIISTGVFQENGEKTERRFPVQEFAFHSVESFRCTYTVDRENRTCACTHTYAQEPHVTSLLYHTKKIPLLFNSRKSTSMWALVNKTALHPITKPVCSTEQFMGQEGKGRRGKTDLDENRKHTCTFVNAWGLPSYIKVLGHSQLQTLLKRQFRLTERSQRSKKKS